MGTIYSDNLSGAIVREQNATTGKAGAVCFMHIVVEVTNACTVLPKLIPIAEVDLSRHSRTEYDVASSVADEALTDLVTACSIAFATARAQRIPCDHAGFLSIFGEIDSPVIADFMATCSERIDPSTLIYQMIRSVWPSVFMRFTAHYSNWATAESSFVMCSKRASNAHSASLRSLARE